MALKPLSFLDPLTDRQRAGTARQVATNRQPSSQMAQQQSQPAGGHFQSEFPSAVSGLAGQLAKQTRPSAQPAPQTAAAPTYQTYYGNTAIGGGSASGTQPTIPPIPNLPPWLSQPHQQGQTAAGPQPTVKPNPNLPPGVSQPHGSLGSQPTIPPIPSLPPELSQLHSVMAPTAQPSSVFSADPYNPIRQDYLSAPTYDNFENYPEDGGAAGPLPYPGEPPPEVIPGWPTPGGPPPPTNPPNPANNYGTRVNLDPAYQRQQIIDAFNAAGKPYTDADVDYYLQQVLTPEIYSDRSVHVGFNPYWAERIATGSSSPHRAGTDGLISDPRSVGYETWIAPNGRTYFVNQEQNWRDGVPWWEAMGEEGSATPTPSPVDPGDTIAPAPAPSVPAPTTPMPDVSGPPEQLDENVPGMDSYRQAELILQQLLSRLDPDTGAMKEAQKETLLAAQEAQREAMLRNAAATGRMGSGRLDAANLELGDQFDQNLTKSYRDIDQESAAAGLANRLAAAQAFQNLGSAQGGLGFNYKQLAQQDKQFYAGLEQQAANLAQQLGFNYAQLDQQNQQFLRQIALQEAIAGQNANSQYLQFMLGLL